MSFFLHINPGTLYWGGLKTVKKDHAYVAPTLSLEYTNPAGQVESLKGIWVLGSGIYAGFTAGKLRGAQKLTDDAIVNIAGENNVVIVVYAGNRLYVYRNHARTFITIPEDGNYEWYREMSDYDIQRVKEHGKPLPNWDYSLTEY